MLIDFSNPGAIGGLILLTIASFVGFFCGRGLNDQNGKRVQKNTRMTRFCKAKSIHRRGMTKNTTT
jgi:hypothetical protein